MSELFPCSKCGTTKNAEKIDVPKVKGHVKFAFKCPDCGNIEAIDLNLFGGMEE
jgi:predicted nucleic-acid-binding Zn-ribbon protein